MQTMRSLLIILLCTSVVAVAVAANDISYQGFLTDSSGNAVADGAYTISVKIFDAPTGGTELWGETQTIATMGGLFSTTLGSTSPIPDSALSDTAAYLEIALDPDPPMSPRTRLASVPYSRISSVLLNSSHNPASGDSAALFIGPASASGSDPGMKWDVVANKPFSGTGASTQTLVSADSGIVSTTFAENSSGMASGKRQHKPLVITKELDVIGSSSAASVSAKLDADSGFSESRQASNSTGDVLVHEVGHWLGQLDFFKRARDLTSGTTIEHDLFLDPDSGLIETTSAENSSGIAKGKRQHRPFAIIKSMDASNSTSSVNVTSMIDVDSGIIVTASAESTTGHMTGKRQHRPITFTKEWGAATALDSIRWNTVLHADSGFADSVEMIQTDLIAGMNTGVNQTREHILLSRQVGVPGATTSSSMELENTNDGPRLTITRDGAAGDPKDDGVVILDASVPSGAAIEMHTSNGAGREGGGLWNADHSSSQMQTFFRDSTTGDSSTVESGASAGGGYLDLNYRSASNTSAIEMQVSDTLDQLLFSQTTAATKYSNITLKRGVFGSAVSVSHVGAAASDGVFISSSAAAGGALGINSSSPVLPFHLVGSGCYTGTFGACSDRRYKKNIETIDGALDLVQSLRGVRYDWKRDEFPEQQFPKGEQVGLIAQEVEAIFPELVATGADGYKSVDYGKLTPVLIEAVKQQQIQIQAQQVQIDELKAMIMKLAESMGKGEPVFGLK